jgi:S1-C subfamily serine protease
VIVRAVSAVVMFAAVLASSLTAQERAGELPSLEVAIEQALRRAAPFTVTVHTFGGMRGASDGSERADFDVAPPKPRETEPEEPKPEEPQPDAPKPDEKKSLPLVRPGFQQSQGRATGLVVGSDGWILTSRFALAYEPTTILVDVPGRGSFTARRRGEDTSRGIALLRIDAHDLPVPEFVPRLEIQVGQWAIALGRTFGGELPTAHLGIVSATDRIFGRAVQTDAATSPVNYGGPLVDLSGRVFGITVPLSPSGRNAGVEWYDSGIGFAATLADLEPLLRRMQNGDVLQRAWLGVQLAPAYLGPGALLHAVAADGPAAAIGLAAGDLVLAVDGTAVRNGPHLQILVAGRLGGDRAVLHVQRGGGTTEDVPVTFTNVPWTQQRGGGDELPVSFPLPKAPEGR